MAELYLNRAKSAAAGGSGPTLSLVATLSGATTSATGLIEANKVYLVSWSATWTYGVARPYRRSFILNTTEVTSGSYKIFSNYAWVFVWFNFANNSNGSITTSYTGTWSSTTRVYEITGWE